MTGSGSDWEDPFLEQDADAQARSRRRAEREARRRGETLPPAAAPVGSDPGSAPPPESTVGEQPETAVAPTVAGGGDGAEPRRRFGGSGSGSGRSRSGQAAAQRRRWILIIAVIGVIAIGVGAALIISGQDDTPKKEKTGGGKKRKTTSFTIPEGLNREQIAATVKEAGIEGDYMAETKSYKGFKPAKYGAEDPPNLEGFLFPATYELYKTDKAKVLVGKQLQAFEDNFAQVDMKYAKSKNLTPYDIVIIASMIEREVAAPEEREKVASVIYNRLSNGTPLGIDATIRYGVGNFDKPLLVSELETDTPYNTRLHTGLPPTPIGNPGLASLEAAANPADTNFMFYVVNPNGCDTHVFVKTQAEFDAAVADYNAAREANDGKAPKNC